MQLFAPVIADPTAVVKAADADPIDLGHKLGEPTDGVPFGECQQGKGRAKVGVLHGLPLRRSWVRGWSVASFVGVPVFLPVGENGANEVADVLESKVSLQGAEVEQVELDGVDVVSIGARRDVLLHTYVDCGEESFKEPVVLRCESFGGRHGGRGQ